MMPLSGRDVHVPADLKHWDTDDAATCAAVQRLYVEWGMSDLEGLDPLMMWEQLGRALGLLRTADELGLVR